MSGTFSTWTRTFLWIEEEKRILVRLRPPLQCQQLQRLRLSNMEQQFQLQSHDKLLSNMAAALPQTPSNSCEVVAVERAPIS